MAHKSKNLLIIITAVMLLNSASGTVRAELSEINTSTVPKINSKDVLTHEDAVVLESLYEVELKKNWRVHYTISRRIRLLSDRACQMYGEVRVGYMKKLQKVTILKGHTTTPEGKKITAKKITDYMPKREMPIYSDTAIKVLAMPGLSKGSEIEYTYKINSSALGISTLYNDFYMMSETIPVTKNRFSIKAPASITLYHNKNGNVDGPNIKKEGSYKTYTWTASDIEPIKFEENMPPLKTLTSWVSLSTSDSWDDYMQSWKKIYRLRSALNPKIKKMVSELVDGAKDDYEKSERIFDYVRNKIRYLGVEFGSANWIPYSAAKVFNSKYGDCKGKTVLIIAMLKACGITAYPAMLTTRENGPTIKEFCNETQFSHVIPVGEIDGSFVWMDPASKAAYGSLPGAIQGVDALVIKDGGSFYRTPVSTAQDNKTELNAVVKYDADGIAEGTISMTGKGNNSEAYKGLMETMTKELKDQFVQTLLNQWVPGAVVSMYDYSDYLETPLSMQLSFEFTSNRQAEKIDGMLVINPIFAANPRIDFVKKERFYDVELDAKECVLKKEEITKPDGFRFDNIPEDYDIQTPHFKAYVRHKNTGSLLTREIYFEWLTTKIPKNEYSQFKKALDEYELWTNKKIILRKI